MSQCTDILEALRRGPITPLEALKDHGCLRLAARIEELRSDGHTIVTEMVKANGKKFGQYVLIKEKRHGRSIDTQS
jgi:hypothetical protein